MDTSFTPHTAPCPKCGGMFYKDESWKRVCISCFIASKKASGTYRPKGSSPFEDVFGSVDDDEADKKREQDRRDKAQQERREREQREWREQKAREQAQREQRERELAAVAKVSIEKEMLRRLIQLCHPDKHANSIAATKATTWLNQIKM